VTTAATPFDAVLGTILYSVDRKMAIVDGRIVQVGDDIKGSTVTEITSSDVFVRDARGAMHRLTIATPRK